MNGPSPWQCIQQAARQSLRRSLPAWLQCFLLLACCCTLGLNPATALATTPDIIDEALRKMCEQGLAADAAEYCEAQAALNSQRPPQRSRWTMRQMECACQAALAAPAANGDGNNEEAWQAVAAIEEAYRREFPEDARLPWLAWQLARADLLRSQQALAKWLATPAAQPQRDAALQAVRRVLSRMEDVEADVKQRLPLSEPRNPESRNQAPSNQLHALAVDCTLLRCEALLVRAKCYPSDSPDRLAALADVDRVAGEMLLRAPKDWSARDELLVARATAGLEVGKRAESKQLLERLLNEQAAEPPVSADSSTEVAPPSPRARIRAGAALVEALCADGDLSAAERALRTLQSNLTGPEIELAEMRVRLARLETQPAPARDSELKSIVEQAQRLGQRYGGYWRNRGEALLVSSAAAGTSAAAGDGGLAQDLVAVEVRQLLAGGQTAAAIAKLRAASENARAGARPEEALQHALQAGALLERERQWTAAADVLTPAALASPDAPQAAAAHALAAWCLAQALKAEPGDAALQRRYEAALGQQLSQWPDAAESLKAEEFLVRWLESQKRFDELATMWRQRGAAASDVELKRRALGQWLETLLSKLPVSQAPAQQTALVAAIGDGAFAACSQTATVTALLASMLTAPLTQTEAETLTGLRLPAHAAEESLTDRALLSCASALAAARRGDAVACRNALQLLPEEQLATVVALAWIKSLVEALDERIASQISGWSDVARAIVWPAAAPANPPPALQMARLRLQMLAAADKPPGELLGQVKQLAEAHPRNADLQISLAAAIAQSDPQRFDEAVRILKRVAVGSSKESDAYLQARWLEVRWRIARGEGAAAAQIAALTLTSAKLPTPWWQARFESVRR